MKSGRRTSTRGLYFGFFVLLVAGAFTLPARQTAAADTWFLPGLSTTFQIQLQGTVNTAYEVNAYDIDLFDTPPSLIDSLHAQGRYVICYFSAGSFEAWRPDAKAFLPADKGRKMSGWNERWLDIRSSNVRAIMRARLDLAQQKGCDGVDPDNVDGYSNKSGFPLTAANQFNYNTFLAAEAHARGLAVALKNDLEQVPDLVAHFDFAVNEQCHEYDECDTLQPFIAAGKPVLNIEYKSKYRRNTSARAQLCADSAALGLATLILPLDLNDKFRMSCVPGG